MKADPRNIMTPKKMKVPYFKWVIMSGVTCPTMKLFIQFEDAPSAIPYGRAESGQTSATRIQALGAVSLTFTSCTGMNLPRTPRPAEMGNEQPHHGDRCPTCRLMCWPLILVLGKNNGYSDMANTHCDGTQRQNRLSSKFVNIQDGWDGGEEHDNTDNACGKKRGRV